MQAGRFSTAQVERYTLTGRRLLVAAHSASLSPRAAADQPCRLQDGRRGPEGHLLPAQCGGRRPHPGGHPRGQGARRAGAAWPACALRMALRALAYDKIGGTMFSSSFQGLLHSTWYMTRAPVGGLSNSLQCPEHYTGWQRRFGSPSPLVGSSLRCFSCMPCTVVSRLRSRPPSEARW